jgi:hypothetical protein
MGEREKPKQTWGMGMDDAGLTVITEAVKEDQLCLLFSIWL